MGAGGACYQWDVNGGLKVAQEEYVDKQKNYCWVEFCSNSSTCGVVVRSLDGKLQHLQARPHSCRAALLTTIAQPWCCMHSESRDEFQYLVAVVINACSQASWVYLHKLFSFCSIL